ncbi:unnamed protein product [Ilex paraguariensis]|uniref:Uncharacterized protein n=1 Tax=Ilex paraguariensis TaxID=185542 RepID=A0ABC8THP0_9AQUA
MPRLAPRRPCLIVSANRHTSPPRLAPNACIMHLAPSVIASRLPRALTPMPCLAPRRPCLIASANRHTSPPHLAPNACIMRLAPSVIAYRLPRAPASCLPKRANVHAPSSLVNTRDSSC